MSDNSIARDSWERERARIRAERRAGLVEAFTQFAAGMAELHKAEGQLRVARANQRALAKRLHDEAMAALGRRP